MHRQADNEACYTLFLRQFGKVFAIQRRCAPRVVFMRTRYTNFRIGQRDADSHSPVIDSRDALVPGVHDPYSTSQTAAMGWRLASLSK